MDSDRLFRFDHSRRNSLSLFTCLCHTSDVHPHCRTGSGREKHQLASYVETYRKDIATPSCGGHGKRGPTFQRAIKHNKTHDRKQGASTISQQTAKNVFLWNGRTWVRKGLETYFTFLIELFWSKQRIMEVYLNSIEMGDGIYGAEAVAKHHFKKSAAVLSRSDCALIAATLPNPRKFSSKTPSTYMLKRQRKIEHEMKFIPSFPKEGESYNPKTVKGGIYHKKK